MNKIIYLAIPYTWNPDQSFKIVNEVAAKLMQEGYVVFSPVSHSHPIADYMDEDLRINQDFWINQDLPILKMCNKLVVIVIGKNGFQLIEDSKGVSKEIETAKELFMDIEYIDYKLK